MTTPHRRLRHVVPAPARQADALQETIHRHVHYAFQPIVGTASGRCFGVEALLRGWQAAGFDSIESIFDEAVAADALIAVDRQLQDIAFDAFRRLPHADKLKLFFNLDNRLFGQPGYRASRTIDAIAASGMPQTQLILEVSERNNLSRPAEAFDALRDYRGNGIQIALDDFGTGFSGLALLYDTHPDFLKIDRYFISELCSDHKKKVFVSHVVSLAKTLGIRVVGEGVETVNELKACHEIGCDFVQGFLIQKPTLAHDALQARYAHVAEPSQRSRRAQPSESRFVAEHLDRAPTIDARMRMEDIFESFRVNPQRAFFPFLNAGGEPMGLIREIELKEYIYSPYGRDLLSRKRIGDNLDLFVRRCPIADMRTPIDRILEQYSMSASRDGVLITDDGLYIGVLSAEALVLAVQERNLELARDQNPLTGLPGNPSIDRFLADHRPDTNMPVVLLYFDLDNFKAFNDKYGFRIGDRALRMLAETLSKTFAPLGAFIGHIGGDDFFVGLQTEDFAWLYAVAVAAIENFCRGAESLYDDADRRAGGIFGKSRGGDPVFFALMSASCACCVLDGRVDRGADADELSLIARLKSEAKLEGNTVCAATAV